MRSRLPVLRMRRRYMIFQLEAEGEIEGTGDKIPSVGELMRKLGGVPYGR